MKNKYIGAIHIHTELSDGTGNVKSISKAAKQNNLDFIIITDHNKFDIDEGIYDGVYVIKGEEISPETENHYLAFNIKNCIEPTKASEYVQEVRRQGGFGFSAHPDESLDRPNKYIPLRWTDKNVIPDGVEIWNWFSLWTDYCNPKGFLNIAYAYLLRHNLIKTPRKETLAWWDKLNNTFSRIVPAIGGVDAHAMKFKRYFATWQIFPYKSMLGTISNVIELDEELSSDFEVAKQQIFKAIKNGHNIIVNRHTSKLLPEIFISNNSQKAYSGENLALDNCTLINIQLGNVFEIRVLHNGTCIHVENSASLSFPINKSGKYRVEISKDGFGFAYSNPIEVKLSD